eukprot:EG_transcript_65149
MAAPSTLSPVLLDASHRRASWVSDCGSSECSSAASAGSSPTFATGTPPRLSPLAVPFATGDGSPALPFLAPAPHSRNSEPAARRPLCLDFLNGKCGRQRAQCRY